MKKILLLFVLTILCETIKAESTPVWQGPYQIYSSFIIDGIEYEMFGYHQGSTGYLELHQRYVNEVIGRVEGNGTAAEVYAAFMEWPNWQAILLQGIQMYNSSPNKYGNWTMIIIPIFV